MKRFIKTLLVLLVLSSFAYSLKKLTEAHNFDRYKYAAEWGCYQGAQKACAHFETDQEVAACQEDALEFCPQAAEAFKKFMERGLKK